MNAKCFIPIAKGTSAHQADHFSEGWPSFFFATILQYYFHVFQIRTYNLHKIIFASQGLRGKYMNQKPLVNEDENGIKLINMHFCVHVRYMSHNVYKIWPISFCQRN